MVVCVQRDTHTQTYTCKEAKKEEWQVSNADGSGKHPLNYDHLTVCLDLENGSIFHQPSCRKSFLPKVCLKLSQQESGKRWDQRSKIIHKMTKRVFWIAVMIGVKLMIQCKGQMIHCCAQFLPLLRK